MANERIDYVLSELGVDIDSSIGFCDEIRCPCPIHGGDNPTAFAYSTRFKQWRCYTARCHENNGSIFSLVQKLKSKNENKEIGFKESAVWLATLLGIKVEGESAKIDYNQQEVNRLVKNAKVKLNLNTKKDLQNNKSSDYPFPLSKMSGKIEPSWYFLEQGFSKEILQKYNVGYCEKPHKPMYLRSYIPVLDESGENVIGATGRIKYEECEYCSQYHEQGKGCPKDSPKVRGYAKWFHDGFKTGSTLFNSWYAKEYINKSGVAVLLEGPKDVLWMEQHGIHNSVCIFGLSILKYHLTRLINMGTTTIVVALDNDEEGLNAIEDVYKNFANYFKIINISKKMPDGCDIADVSSKQMIEDILPTIQALGRK